VIVRSAPLLETLPSKVPTMKILLAAGALALTFVLAITAGRPARPLDDLRWQSGQPYALAPYSTAKVGRPEALTQVALASSTLERR